MKNTKRDITPVKAIAIFSAFTAYFFFLLFTLLPFLKSNFTLNSALYWFITGYFLFIPMFAFSVIMVKREGNRGIKQIISALNIKPFTRKDWIYSTAGLLIGFILTGIIFGTSLLLNKYLGVRMLETTPWFMEFHPFQGIEKLLLLVWLPMFFFNIVGEEILWRGYVQNRLRSKYSWQLCSLLWLMFHLTFGIDLIIMAVPFLIIIPYVFHKTRNTLTGIFLHGIFNGPIFIAIALGLVK